MKVYKELKVWIDFDEEEQIYILGYVGSNDVIKTILHQDGDSVISLVWKMLHEDMS